MNNSCFIPKTIKVGYQNRKDTYSGKLAYVIYYDEKNKLRKETSWENWRDKKIPFENFDNICLEGFVLNKKTGDYHWDWYSNRQAYIRVFDPRGFEVEITVNNLLYILENCDSIKGKGLSGRFCYGWYGTDLVLIPECSEGYKESKKYTDTLYAQKKIKKSELKIGQTYLLKKNEKVIYLGYHNHFENYIGYGHHTEKCNGTYYGKYHYYICLDDLNKWDDKNDQYNDYYFQSVNKFNPIDVSDEEYDYTKIMKKFNEIVFKTGKYLCYYDENDFKKALKSCKNGIYIWEKNKFEKTFLKKKSDNTVIYQHYIGAFHDTHEIELTIKDLVRGQYGYYHADFVNGNIVKKEKYMEIE